MKTLTKNKKSKYIVYIGYGMCLYTTSINDVNDLIHVYGSEKVSYKKI